MREYLFRGKDVDTKEWVYGGYCQHDTVKVCFTTDDPKTKHMIIKDGFCDWGLEPPLQGYEVDPETVGQYTELKDKNGVKIFEGDIVQTKTVDTHEYRRTVIGIGLCVESRDDTPCIGVNFDYFGEQVILQVDMMEHLEVIGNIHDNPDLLKEGGEECLRKE